MSLSKKFHKIRQKPRHVRERYIIVVMLIVAPLLVLVWILTYRYDSSTSGTDFFKSIGSSVSTSFNSPVYKDTFGEPSFGGTATSTP